MTADQLEKELGWERGVDYPEWGHTDVYLQTISKGYCLPGAYRPQVFVQHRCAAIRG